MKTSPFVHEDTLAHYLETGEVECPEIKRLIKNRKLFPCWFGSALKLDGVKELLNGLEMYTEMPEYPKAFGAKVFKIAHDNQGARLTYLKVTGALCPLKWSLKAARAKTYGQKKPTSSASIPVGNSALRRKLPRAACAP